MLASLFQSSAILPGSSGKVSSFLNLEVEKFVVIILPNVGGGKECLYCFRNSDHLLHLETSLLVKYISVLGVTVSEV